MGRLSEILDAPERKRRIVDDAVGVIDEEVDSKGGISGFAVKAGYKAVKAVKPGIIASAVEALLPEFARKLDPFDDRRRAEAPGETLERYLTRRSAEVADALLEVTDERARRSENAVIRGAYGKLRPSGKRHVEEALPRVGRLLDRHLA